jgi:hypothetical protein
MKKTTGGSIISRAANKPQTNNPLWQGRGDGDDLRGKKVDVAACESEKARHWARSQINHQ